VAQRFTGAIIALFSSRALAPEVRLRQAVMLQFDSSRLALLPSLV